MLQSNSSNNMASSTGRRTTRYCDHMFDAAEQVQQFPGQVCSCLIPRP